MRIRLRLLFLLVFSGTFLGGQNTQPGDSVRFRLVTVYLDNGTRIWGMLDRESVDSISVTDFNAGYLSINRRAIRTMEIVPLQGNVVIETVNGSNYYGTVINLVNGTLLLSSPSLGTIEIPCATLARINITEGYVNRKGSTWFSNPNATRYFFAPSAIPLKKQEGYFQNAYLLANSVNVGVTNNITLGGGVVIPVLFYVTPKVSFKAAKNLYFGGGILYTQSFINDVGLSAGIAYGLATIGNPEHNFTIGSGYGFAKFDRKYKQTPMPIITLNGMTRIARKMSLVTENWLIPRAGYNKDVLMDDPLGGPPYYESVYQEKNFYSAALSLGLRFMPGIKTSVDFSVVGIRTSPGQSDMVLPYLDFVYKF